MPKVLVLEDDTLSHKVVERVLTNAGHEFIASHSAEEAWSKLHEHVLVDMLVLDNQLRQEWGWQFLRKLRDNPAYRGLPVIVYTGHAERSSMVRYVEIGVQSLHIKPYQSDVLINELKKAVETKWTEQLMERAETMCGRLKISPAQYCSLLATANRTIEESLGTALRRLTNPNDPQLFAALENIEQQCRAVGIAVIEGVIKKIKGQIHDANVVEAVEGLRGIDSFLRMIQHRMLATMKIEDSIARDPGRLENVTKAVSATPTIPAASFAASYVREMVGGPMWQFGPLLRERLRQPLMDRAGLSAMMSKAAATVLFRALHDTQILLEGVPKMAVPEAVRVAQETRGFVQIYQRVMEQLTGNSYSFESAAALPRVVGQHGIAKTMVLAAAARVANALPQDGLLKLRPLFVHSLTSAMLAFEIGRLFKLVNDFMLAAAGLAHDAGRWMFAIGEPGIYALALAVSEDGEIGLPEVEKRLFGLTHHEAGGELLAVMAMHSSAQAAAAWHYDPGLREGTEDVLTVTVLHLAHLIAQSVLATPTARGAEILEPLADPNYVAWRLLKSKGVVLPMEERELVTTIAAMAKTSRWIAEQLLDQKN